MGNGYKSDKKMTVTVLVLLIITITVIISGIIHDKKRDKDNEKVVEAYQKKELGQPKDKKTQEKQDTPKNTKDVGKGKVLKYIAVGDSVTAGYSATSQDNFFVNKLSSLITNNMGFQVEKNNMGKRGSLISEAINNVNEINSAAPDVITIEYGTNDSNSANNISAVAFENQLNNFIDDVTIKVKRNPIIVLMTTWNVNYGENYDQVINSVGQKRNIPVVNLKPIWSDKTNIGPSGEKTYYGVSDEFNPNDKGMNAIASDIYGKIQPILYERNNK
ncbi:lysophospholipase L1-like esterase [Clostridium acetobutylicum]|uniref:Acyl-CoA thioesterase family protein n=1 Tax=Clostridium acetobutylicum (strain ATCC 824 / DSM 792 / JCM 1419 / IAM 19013 / LMG 5710 / NBRC 13948 / NRRL B-527 / VKM B-1787 / 2291 / W) TaxID=272562 RepID=Q97FV7_CLOAB|nr:MULTISPECIES: SGNH/GDSL hydrolase family protein [Clostridium]AAK80566.1 Acyl-CoA thioesterase family protein [Clostridium acetobutylicum ATCC 824]ADZ21665.1 Acyl-CoA thioesterase family protein [Clostridium acetobutylicum EA 2018]AEI32470.1 Acyl-CoA thioesterase family protein [Clostridium acetobutylicum DSM 1731]AWV79017.1 SGNH/GDSL hydrolase family protein [Clostridium acetobutylicum]MBC2395023.1 SGNH/GDSL hydrolase family protein [Clostridium acetobutylicum]